MSVASHAVIGAGRATGGWAASLRVRGACCASTSLALQAAPGQWPGRSPGTNGPLDRSCPGAPARVRGCPRQLASEYSRSDTSRSGASHPPAPAALLGAAQARIRPGACDSASHGKLSATVSKPVDSCR